MNDVMKKTKIALEDEISRIIMADNGCTAHFEYKQVFPKKLGGPAEYKVTVMTYNNHSKTTFLLKEIDGTSSEEEGLEEVLRYVKSHKEDYDSFTIVWARKGTGDKSEKSYFYCKDLFEALEKFYFNKNREEYIIYEAIMNAKA